MSFLFPKSLSIGRVCNYIWKNIRRDSEFIAVGCHRSFMSKASGTHSKKKGPESVKSISSICNLLRGGGNWDNLNADFKSVELTDDLVERVLLILKEPTDAKKALVFFHWCSHQRKFRHGLRSYGVVVHILVCAGLLIDAQAMLESAIRKHPETTSSGISFVETLLSTHDITPSSPRVFDLLVQTYSKLRMLEMAFGTCRYLSERGRTLSLISFNTLLHVVQKSDDVDLIWKIYEHMVFKRRYPNQATIEIMIAAMCKGGALQKTIDVLDRILGKRCSPGVIVNTELALRMIDGDRAQEGALLLNRMLQQNIVLDDVAYSLSIYAHCKIGKLELAHDLYDNLIKRGQCLNSFIFTSLIGTYCKEGRIKEANGLFQEMLLAGLKPYAETYNVLIECCSRVGRVEESISFYEEMLGRGFLPSCVAVNEMIDKLCESERVETANNMLTVLLDKGFVPNEVTYSHLIEGFGRTGNAHEILKIHYEMEWKGPIPGQIAYTSLIQSLCQCKKLTEAERYLSLAKDKSFVLSRYVYDALIKAHYDVGNVVRALHFYDEMIQKGLEPSSYIFTIMTKGILSGSTIEV